MKFVFRLETVLKQRKVEQDLAQKDFAVAQDAVRKQLKYIEELYTMSDNARLMAERLQSAGGSCTPDLVQINEFIDGQKTKIKVERQKARELMAIAEEKQEILVVKMREHKSLVNLKDKQKAEFVKEKNKKEQIETDDLTIMRQGQKEKRFA